MSVKIRFPAFPVQGGCACGAVRYEIAGPPMAILACCCSECQTITASAFSMAAPVRRDDFRITKGEPGTWIRTGGSGAKIPQRHCRACGVRLFTEHPSSPATISLRPGTLDDTSWIAPVAAIHLRDAQPWTRFPDGTVLFDGEPDDPPAIGRAWKAAVQS